MVAKSFPLFHFALSNFSNLRFLKVQIYLFRGIDNNTHIHCATLIFKKRGNDFYVLFS